MIRLNKFWNGKLSSIPMLIWLFSRATLNKLKDQISSFFWKYNFNKVGYNLIVQFGVDIRWPKNFSIGNNVSIGRYCQFSTEFDDSIVIIGNNSQINKNCTIDFSGGLIIGDSVVISENVNIMTHSHGYDPISKPIKKQLIIEDRVWVGSGVTILPQVDYIGHESIIASGSILTQSVMPKSIYGGNPARLIKSIL